MLSFMDTRGKIGVGLKKNADGLIVVARLSTDGPAQQSGMQVGDVLEAVDGKPVPPSAEAASARLHGAVDSVVTIKVKRNVVFGSSSVTINIVRKDFEPLRSPQTTASPCKPASIQANLFSNNGIWDLSSGFAHVKAAIDGGVGIGVKLKKKDGCITVQQIARGGGAEQSGRVQVNDVIVKVDGTAVRTVEEATERLMGPRGTEVELQLRRPAGFFGFQVIDAKCIREAAATTDAAPKSSTDKLCRVGSPRPGNLFGIEAPGRPADSSSMSTFSEDPFEYVNGLVMSGMGLGGDNVGEIGIEFSIEGKKAKKVVIDCIAPNGPAAREGSLRVGDHVLEINQMPVATNITAIRTQVRGEKGKPVLIKIERDSFLGPEMRIVHITRDVVPDQSKGAPAPKPLPASSNQNPAGFLEGAAYSLGLQTFTCAPCSSSKEYFKDM